MGANPALRLPVVPDDPVHSARLHVRVDSDSRSARRRFSGMLIHIVTRLCAWLVLRVKARRHILRVPARGAGIHF